MGPPVGIDLELVGKLHDLMLGLGREDVENALATALENLLSRVQYGAETIRDPRALQQFLIVLQSPLLLDPNYALSITAKLLGVVVKLSADMRSSMTDSFQLYDKELLESTVGMVQQFITVRLLSERTIDRKIMDATKVLGMLHRANEQTGHLTMTAFYNDAINDELDMDADYARWIGNQEEFCFCNYSYMLDPA